MSKRMSIHVADTLMALYRDFPGRLLPLPLISNDPLGPMRIYHIACRNLEINSVYWGYLCSTNNQSPEYEVDKVARLCFRRAIGQRDEVVFADEDLVDIILALISRNRARETRQMTHLSWPHHNSGLLGFQSHKDNYLRLFPQIQGLEDEEVQFCFRNHSNLDKTDLAIHVNIEVGWIRLNRIVSGHP